MFYEKRLTKIHSKSIKRNSIQTCLRSDFYGRSKNREIEYVVRKHIEEFEKKYGVIPVPERFQDKETEE